MVSVVNWQMACIKCGNGIGPYMPSIVSICCSRCGSRYPLEQNILHCLAEERRNYYSGFLKDYTRIRLAEGRGADDPSYFTRLPETNQQHPLAWQWRIRARSYAYLNRRFLAGKGTGLKVLDLGAGVGWLSHRLYMLGHNPCAVDLTVDPEDGLAAGRYYKEPWPRLRAEFDRLPLADGEADLAIFNASFHYSADYSRTLRETLRVLRPGGNFIIMDSPLYRSAESGEQMKRERHEQFESQYGFRSDSLPSIEYLAPEHLVELSREFGIRWRLDFPWYGWKWALRPVKAALLRKREPSRFGLYIGSVPANDE